MSLFFLPGASTWRQGLGHHFGSTSDIPPLIFAARTWFGCLEVQDFMICHDVLRGGKSRLYAQWILLYRPFQQP